MAAKRRCPQCEVEVPAENFELHCVRCPGKANAAGAGTTSPGGYATTPRQAAPDSSNSGPSCTQLVQELTWARTRPAEVAEALRERLGHYKGKDYHPPERRGRCVVTKEGAAAVQEAITFAKNQATLGGVGTTSELGLSLAAEDHVADIGQTGTASHSSSDGTCAADRVIRYGSFGKHGECLWYGSELADARSIVLDLIVDDGVPSRGHRNGIYDRAYTVVGTAYGAHSTFGRMAAMEFARDWQGNAMFIRSRQQTGPPKLSGKAVAQAKAKATTAWKLGVCPCCNEPIKGGRVIEVKELGGKLHADCFKCDGCSQPLAGVAWKPHDKKPYCKACFDQQFGEKCAACNLVISGGVMKCSLGSFHPECVVCATCTKVIGKGSFSTTSGSITCQACSSGSQPSARRAASPPPGKARPKSPLFSAGSAIATTTANRATTPRRAGGGNAAEPKAKAKATSAYTAAGPKAKAPAKAKAKVSMAGAKANLMGLGMNYGDLE